MSKRIIILEVDSRAGGMKCSCITHRDEYDLSWKGCCGHSKEYGCQEKEPQKIRITEIKEKE